MNRSDHGKALQCIPYSCFFFRWYLGLWSAVWRGKIIVLTNLQAAFSLDLGDIEAGNFQTMVIQNVVLDLRIAQCSFVPIVCNTGRGLTRDPLNK